MRKESKAKFQRPTAHLSKRALAKYKRDCLLQDWMEKRELKKRQSFQKRMLRKVQQQRHLEALRHQDMLDRRARGIRGVTRRQYLQRHAHLAGAAGAEGDKFRKRNANKEVYTRD